MPPSEPPAPPRPAERVAKLMAQRGLCSRREAERLIEAGQVVVDGVVQREQGCKAAPDADIHIAAAGAQGLSERVTVVLHKPLGIVSTQPEPGQKPAWTLLRAQTAHGHIEPAQLRRVLADPPSLAVAGRLDRASRGLLLMTQDGTIARRVIGGQGVEKRYLVRTAEAPSDAQINKLRALRELDGEPLRPMRVDRAAPDTLRFTLIEGKKHQIRRVCRRFGLEVIDLFRVAIGPLSIGDLPEGKWRLVGDAELERLKLDGRVGQ